ncbi:hypothetical protein L218DRAFT_261403 [Marasmius fiardii PR-910]|nr:hypothetical protein L218DRAFT_261403 [Marasmius fiardii PR-910]
MLRTWLGILSLFLARLVAGFSLNVPSSVFVNDQFSLNWTWLTSEPTSIVVVLNDISKAPDCPKDTSLREASYVILDLVKRAGNLGLYVKREGTFQTCAWSYTPKYVPFQPLQIDTTS